MRSVWLYIVGGITVAVLVVGYRYTFIQSHRSVMLPSVVHDRSIVHTKGSIIPKANITESVDGSVGSGLDFAALGKLVSDSVEAEYSEVQVPHTIAMAVTSHHLPVASPVIGQLYKTLRGTTGDRHIFVVVGPDHYEACGTAVVTTKRAYRTAFGTLANNTEIVDELVRSGLDTADDCFSNEHAMAVESNYIKYIDPKATIVPILFSIQSGDEEISNVIRVLAKHMSEITIIVSVDFNHYHSLSVANESDSKAAIAIRALNDNAIVQDMLDSPSSMKLAIRMAKKYGFSPYILRRANSYEFTGVPKNTTSYMNVVFGK